MRSLTALFSRLSKRFFFVGSNRSRGLVCRAPPSQADIKYEKTITAAIWDQYYKTISAVIELP